MAWRYCVGMMAHEQADVAGDIGVPGNGLFARAGSCLQLADPAIKSAAVAALLQEVRAGRWARDAGAPEADLHAPGRPGHLVLVPPKRLPKRGMGSREGRLVFMHAVAHIEFNAINLALDAVHRFRDMPDAYYRDWLGVADEEARHFAMVRAYLQAFGTDYGDHPAHDGLWEMAVRTGGDVLERMALVPRVLEARGLDVTPSLIGKLVQAGDAEAAGILSVIYEEEVGHVGIGTRWFRFLCGQRRLEPAETFFALLARHFPDGLHGPYNLPARQRAGFSSRELSMLSEGL
jgi:uncharacterized ferritin-like protein (DUF455 family)